MTVLVFDLDDTLYDELTYVKSGFQVVSNYISNSFGLTESEVFHLMWKLLKSIGRGRVFDEMLKQYDIYNKTNLRKCISVYRLHQPKIILFPEAEICLQRFTHLPKYIVTDGNKIVQHNKLVALKLYERMKYCYITHRYGTKHSKPSPYCFEKIAQREHVRPTQIIYIADNPNKDFVGIKPLGYKTIRVKQGQYKDIALSNDYEADMVISSLNEINEYLITQLT